MSFRYNQHVKINKPGDQNHGKEAVVDGKSEYGEQPNYRVFLKDKDGRIERGKGSHNVVQPHTYHAKHLEADNITESIEEHLVAQPPMIILLKRTGVRQFIGGQNVALYENTVLGLKVSIPYDSKKGISKEVITAEEAIEELSNQPLANYGWKAEKQMSDAVKNHKSGKISGLDMVKLVQKRVKGQKLANDKIKRNHRYEPTKDLETSKVVNKSHVDQYWGESVTEELSDQRKKDLAAAHNELKKQYSNTKTSKFMKGIGDAWKEGGRIHPHNDVKPKNEETIDELKNSTVASYLGKAVKDKEHQKKEIKERPKKAYQAHKEGKEGEAYYHNAQADIAVQQKAARERGIDRATDRLANLKKAIKRNT